VKDVRPAAATSPCHCVLLELLRFDHRDLQAILGRHLVSSSVLADRKAAQLVVHIGAREICRGFALRWTTRPRWIPLERCLISTAMKDGVASARCSRRERSLDARIWLWGYSSRPVLSVMHGMQGRRAAGSRFAIESPGSVGWYPSFQRCSARRWRTEASLPSDPHHPSAGPLDFDPYPCCFAGLLETDLLPLRSFDAIQVMICASVDNRCRQQMLNVAIQFDSRSC
jgi:hypothetical protein